MSPDVFTVSGDNDDSKDASHVARRTSTPLRAFAIAILVREQADTDTPCAYSADWYVRLCRVQAPRSLINDQMTVVHALTRLSTLLAGRLGQ